MLLTFPLSSLAKCGSVDYSQGAEALARMHDYVVTMMLYVLYVLYAGAGITAIISALQIYIKMNMGEDGVMKAILTLIGAICHQRLHRDEQRGAGCQEHLSPPKSSRNEKKGNET
jgi:hypothetical protein